jgi:predicted nucleic acid-binding protein/GNAT superfamily N-acetyltransferase
MQIKVIDQNDPILKEVVALGKKNAKTLGMFPEGAFIDHAKKKTIIAALEGEVLIGYILFRITQSKRMISIAHLCIDTEQRNKGVAKTLLNTVREKYQHLFKGIKLSCRKDYIVASKFYEKYGFKAANEVRSRSKEENYLVKWYYDFGNDDLFSSTLLSSSKTNALLDASILIKLRDMTEGENIEVISLNADWLMDEVEYFYAPEMFNEINRDTDKQRAGETRKFLGNYKEARFTPEERDAVYEDLSSIFTGTSDNDISDRKQLSECIASGIDCFVTTDEELINGSDKVYEKHSTRVLHPKELILLIDQIKNKSDYNSVRLAGANYEAKNIEANDVNTLSDVFICKEFDEKKHEFKNLITTIISDLKKSHFKVVKDSAGSYIGIVGGKIDEANLSVSILRTYKSKISAVLFYQLVNDILSFAVENNITKVSIDEKHLNEIQHEILDNYGFEKKDNAWLKLVIKGQFLTEEFLNENTSINDIWDVASIKNKLSVLKDEEKNLFKFQLERKLSPLKFLDIDIPTYVIPIRPYWASQLFDYHQANQSLFGSKPELAWHRENIYYRNVKPVSEKCPARILWYISSESKSATGRHMGIIACSYLDEVSTGTAKSLFQKFKNYGIYEWKDIYDAAGKDAFKEMKAIKFSDTEVFKDVITIKQIAEIFEQNGKPKNTFTSPVEVSKEIFNQIYKIGKAL